MPAGCDRGGLSVRVPQLRCTSPVRRSLSAGLVGLVGPEPVLKCAAALAHGNLAADSYLYPLGYPALGAIFYRWMPEHAFLVPNLILVLGIAALFFEIAKRLVTPLEAALLLAAFTFCYRGLLSDTLVVPWNTIPTHFLTYAVILLVAFGPVTKKKLLLSALCVGLMYLCRQADAFCMGPLVGIALLRLPSWSERIRTGLLCLAIVGFFWALILLVNHAVFGAWITPYEEIVRSIGFGAYQFLPKLFWLIVDSRPVFNEPETALSAHFPWLLLVIPGAVYFVRRYSPGAVGILLSIGATYAIYFQFNDFWPGNMFKYLVVHYLVWTFPLLALLAYLAIRDAWKSRLGLWSFGFTIVFGATMWLLMIRQEVVARLASPTPLTGQLSASAAQPVDWVLFRGLDAPPILTSGNSKLEPMVDFISPRHFDGLLVVLSKRARHEPVGFDASAMAGLRGVEYGRFIWRFQSVGKALRNAIDHFYGPRVVSVAKVPEIDIAGPQGGPDGQPDEVIELELPEAALKKITVWDLATEDGSAHWISTPNSRAWWLIKTQPSSRILPKGRDGIRLCFPNFGQLEISGSAILRGVDDGGQVHARLTVRPNTPSP